MRHLADRHRWPATVEFQQEQTEWKDKEPFASLLKGDVKGALAGGEPAIFQIVMATHTGIVHHTDAGRQWAYDRQSSIGQLDKALNEAKAKGWTVVDMK